MGDLRCSFRNLDCWNWRVNLVDIEPSLNEWMGFRIDLVRWGVSTNDDNGVLKYYLGSMLGRIGVGPITHLVKLGYLY